MTGSTRGASSDAIFIMSVTRCCFVRILAVVPCCLQLCLHACASACLPRSFVNIKSCPHSGVLVCFVCPPCRAGDRHPVIIRFWNVMTTLSEAEKAAVVGFAWGRSRLPAAGKGMVNFNIDGDATTANLYDC